MPLDFFFDSGKQLHHLVDYCHDFELASFLKHYQRDPVRRAKVLETYDGAGFTPLWNAVFHLNYEYRNNLEKVLLLLEAGADPYARTSRGQSLLHHLIDERRLSLIRLMLWFNPDFEAITNSDSPLTALDWLKQEFSHPPSHCYIELIQKTAVASRKIRALTEKARLASSLEERAECLQHIASIYAEHWQIEKDYQPSFSERNYKFRDQPVLLEFYQKRADAARQQAYAALTLALKQYRSLLDPSRADLAAQLKCLEKLADLARELKWSDKAIQHSSACAKLIDQLARSQQAEETNINPLIEERNPLLFKGIRHRQIPPAVIEVDSGKYNCFSRLKRY